MKYNSNQTKYEKLSKNEKKENFGDVKTHPESEVRIIDVFFFFFEYLTPVYTLTISIFDFPFLDVSTQTRIICNGCNLLRKRSFQKTGKPNALPIISSFKKDIDILEFYYLRKKKKKN